MTWASVRKAVVAAVVAGVAAAATALQDGALTAAEVGTIVGAVAVAAYATWKVPNAAGRSSPTFAPAHREGTP